jgi:tRNA(Ile)-lysidine synthase
LGVSHKIRRTIQRHALLPAGSRVVVGLSGGSDSVALACLLLDISVHGGFEVAGLAHVNHRLRATAERDEAFCRDLAARLGQAFVTETVDVRSAAESQGRTVEDAARRLRYDALARAARQLRAGRIAVGHTQDDQAETLLLKLVRGAGSTGLAGIYPERGQVVRPLLDVSRAELRRHLESAHMTWVDDETNEDLDNPRNRIRHVVLPELERSYGGSVHGALARAADILREDGQLLDELSDRRWAVLVTPTTDGLSIDAAGLGAEPRPIVRRWSHCAATSRPRGKAHRPAVRPGHRDTALRSCARGPSPSPRSTRSSSSASMPRRRASPRVYIRR